MLVFVAPILNKLPTAWKIKTFKLKAPIERHEKKVLAVWEAGKHHYPYRLQTICIANLTYLRSFDKETKHNPRKKGNSIHSSDDSASIRVRNNPGVMFL